MRTLFAAALFASANAIYEGLIQIDDSNYEDLVLKDDKNMWVITYYADWCPYAMALEKELLLNSRYMQVAGYNIKYGAVNVRECPELVHRYEIKRSPTIEIYGQDKEAPERYGGSRTSGALNVYMEEECTYFGYDKAVVKNGYIKKDEYDVEACEADMNTAQEYRLNMYDEHLVGAKAKETEIYETAKVAIKQSFEQQIKEIVIMEEQTLKMEDDRHVAAMTTHDDTYERKVEDAIYEHEEIVKGLRDAYLQDMDLDQYLATIDDASYLSEIKAEDYIKTVKVKSDKVSHVPQHMRNPYGPPVYGPGSCGPAPYGPPGYGPAPYAPSCGYGYQAPPSNYGMGGYGSYGHGQQIPGYNPYSKAAQYNYGGQMGVEAPYNPY